MEKRRIFRDRQELRADDWNDLQSFTRQSLDHVVRDAISDDRRFTGLTVSQESTTEIKVDAGRMYDTGAVYLAENSRTKDLLNDLAVSSKRTVSVVVFPETVETNVEPRDFLTDVDSGTTEPDTVAINEWRRAQVDYVSGSESVAPNAPAVPSGAIRVADVLLDTSGIVSITMTAKNRLGGLQKTNKVVHDLEAFRSRIRASVDALHSTVAGLKDATADKASWTAFQRLVEQFAVLRREAGLPSGITMFGFDDFRDDARTAVGGTFGDEAHRLDGALTFPSGGVSKVALDLYNPLDVEAKKYANGWLFPSNTTTATIETSGASGEVALSSFQVQTQDTRTRTTYKTATRTGQRRRLTGFTVNVHEAYTEAAKYGGDRIRPHTFTTSEASYDPNAFANGVDWDSFSSDWDNWSASTDKADLANKEYDTTKYTYQERVPQQETYTVNTTEQVSGATLAQTFVVPRNAWIVKIGLHFSDLDSSGDVTVMLTELSGGRPNLNAVRSKTTVPYANLNASAETVVTMTPAFVRSGTSLALVVVTNANHKHNVVDGVGITQGTIMHKGDSGWQRTNDGQSLLFSVRTAQFNRTQSHIRLQDASVSGGIRDIEISAQQRVPEGTEIVYEYQAGGVWYPLHDADALMANTPSTLPIRVVMTGSTEVQPAIKTGTNQVEASYSDTSLVHYSTQRQLPQSTSELYVDIDLAYFDAAEESVDIKLLDADNNNAEIAPASDTVLREEQVANSSMYHQARRFKFTPSSLQNYYIRTSGSTSATTPRPFHVKERLDSAV